LKPLETGFLKGFFIKATAAGLKRNTKGRFVAFKAIETYPMKVLKPLDETFLVA